MVTLFLAFTSGYLTYIIVNVLLNSPYAAYTEICLENVQKPRHLPAWKMFLLQSPNILHLFALIFAIKLVRLVKSTIIPTNNLYQEPLSTIDINLRSQKENNQTITVVEDTTSLISLASKLKNKFKNIFKIKSSSNESVDKIPIQASIFSSILIFPYVILFILTFAFNLTDEHRGMINRGALTFSSVLRCPLTVVMTYKSKKKTSEDQQQQQQQLELDDFDSGDERF
jgi:hypothetical protein